ncbi:MAG TPA: hypothetical protein DEQ30_11770 [Porphyromonadaceae bacterium]|nr:hypothetical protein [Porphyromonadaceae bacterium]
MEKRNSAMIILMALFLFGLYGCRDKSIEIIYYENSKQVKEQRQFFLSSDTSYYEYTSYYLNGRMKSQGMVIDMKREGIWREWYGDGMLRRELYYADGELNFENENRKIPEIIFESDSLFLNVKTKMKVLHIYPDETMPFTGLNMWRLTDDSCYDFGIVPWTTDSVQIFYFSPVLSERIDTICLKDIHNPEQLDLTDEEFKELKEFNPDLKITNRVSKMITLKKVAVYENKL